MLRTIVARGCAPLRLEFELAEDLADTAPCPKLGTLAWQLVAPAMRPQIIVLALAALGHCWVPTRTSISRLAARRATAAAEVHELFVRNLEYTTTSEELEAAVAGLGGDLGAAVEGVRIPRDRATGKNRGFGFVAFDSGSSARAALDAMDGAELNGRQLRVEMSATATPAKKASPDAAAVALNKRIVSCESAESILALVDACPEGELSTVNLATAVHRLGRLGRVSRGDARLERLFAVAITRMGDEGGEGGPWAPREFANIAHGVARLRPARAARILGPLARAATPCLGGFTPQELASTAWAFATAGVADAPFLDAIAAEATARAGTFSARQLANLAWAYAKTRSDAPALFNAIGRAAPARIDEFSPQHISNTAWAFAKTRRRGPPALFGALATAAEEKIDGFTSQNLANTAWAFARAGVTAPSLFAAIAREAGPRLGEFSAQGLENLRWAFETAGVDAPELLGAIEQRDSTWLTGFLVDGVTLKPKGGKQRARARVSAGATYEDLWSATTTSVGSQIPSWDK